MYSAETTLTIRSRIQAQHRELHFRVRAIHHLLNQIPEAAMLDSLFTRLTEQLRELQSFLVDHFSLEEQGGFVEDAVTRLPRLAADVTALEKEHKGLLVEIASLIVAAEVENDTPLGWKSLSDKFHAFARMLLAHEAAENRILQQGLNEDLEIDEAYSSRRPK